MGYSRSVWQVSKGAGEYVIIGGKGLDGGIVRRLHGVNCYDSKGRGQKVRGDRKGGEEE